MPSVTGPRVLITRAQESLSEMTQAVATAGGEPVALPLIAFEIGQDVAHLQGDIAALTAKDWIVLTSRRAAKPLALAYSLCGACIATVGSQTSKALRSFGLEPNLVGSGADGALALAQRLLNQDPQPQSVLWCTSNLAREEFASMLQEHGVRVLRREVYRTTHVLPDATALEQALSPSIQAAILASPSAVDALMKALPLPWIEAHQPSLRIVVPGRTTAESARSAGWQQVVVAKSPTARHLAEAAIS